MIDRINHTPETPEPTEILVGGNSHAIEMIVNGERPEIRAALVAQSLDQQIRREHLMAQLDARRSLRRR